MKLRGQVLAHPEAQDPDVLVYSVLEPTGQVRLYVSNKSRQEAKSLNLELTGGPWSSDVQVKRMAVGTGGYVDAPALRMTDGKFSVQLDPLTIQRLTVRPSNAF